MKPLIKRTLVILAVPAVILVGYGLYRGVCIGTAYKAKTLCSGVFVAKRTPESVLSQDLAVDDLSTPQILQGRHQ